MTCPNCGQEFEGDRCPHCGRPRSNTGNRIAAVALLVFLVFPAGLFGACSAIVAVSSLTSHIDVMGLLLFVALTAGGLGVAYFAMQAVRRLW